MEYLHQFTITRNSTDYTLRTPAPEYRSYDDEGTPKWGIYLPLEIQTDDWTGGTGWVPLKEQFPNADIDYLFTQEEYVSACSAQGTVQVNNAAQRAADLKAVIEQMVDARWGD